MLKLLPLSASLQWLQESKSWMFTTHQSATMMINQRLMAAALLFSTHGVMIFIITNSLEPAQTEKKSLLASANQVIIFVMKTIGQVPQTGTPLNGTLNGRKLVML